MHAQGEKALAIPHLSVPDIRSLDWKAMKAAGLKGVVFDKDNTLTEPFSPLVDARLRPSLAACLDTFGSENVVLYSNSAGLAQYDPRGRESREVRINRKKQ